MSFRYNSLSLLGRKIYRKFFPMVPSSYTIGPVADICAVRVLDPKRLEEFFEDAIHRLQSLKGDNIGDYLEFGVFNGTSLSCMYRVAEKLGLTIRLFGFDAFEGLPAESEHEDAGVWKKGFYSCSFDQLQECLRRNSINPASIAWVKGWYKDTLTPALVGKFNLNNPGIVFVDCDTYSSSRSVLDFIAPLIKAPVILCLDDWRLNDLDLKGLGEYKSFNEFLEANPRLRAEEIGSYKRNARCFVVRPT